MPVDERAHLGVGCVVQPQAQAPVVDVGLQQVALEPGRERVEAVALCAIESRARGLGIPLYEIRSEQDLERAML